MGSRVVTVRVIKPGGGSIPGLQTVSTVLSKAQTGCWCESVVTMGRLTYGSVSGITLPGSSGEQPLVWKEFHILCDHGS